MIMIFGKNIKMIQKLMWRFLQFFYFSQVCCLLGSVGGRPSTSDTSITSLSLFSLVGLQPPVKTHPHIAFVFIGKQEKVMNICCSSKLYFYTDSKYKTKYLRLLHLSDEVKAERELGPKSNLIRPDRRAK